MPLQPCIDCGTPTSGSRCRRHQAPRDAADARRRNAKTRTHGVKRAHFQHLRRERVALARGLCELNVDRDCTTVATTVHLDPSLAGDHDHATIDDVRAACAHCHGVTDGARSRR